MTACTFDLADLGWNPFYQAQLEPAEWHDALPVRVMAVHRGGLEVAGPRIATRIPPLVGEEAAAVGDWLLLDAAGRPLRLLACSSGAPPAPGARRS
jgi:ribosome biogenesis GTPase